MSELYCNPCGGTVNEGGLCPHAKQPNGCPLHRTEARHMERLERLKQEAEKPKVIAPPQ